MTSILFLNRSVRARWLLVLVSRNILHFDELFPILCKIVHAGILTFSNSFLRLLGNIIPVSVPVVMKY